MTRPDALEGSELFELFCNLHTKSSVSPHAAETPVASTGSVSDSPLCTVASPEVTSTPGDRSTLNSKSTSSGNFTGLLTTSHLPQQHTPQNMTASVATEDVGTSNIWEESSFRALCCPFPGCNSRTLFLRPCDLNKHYRQHFKRFFCRIEGCHMSEQATLNGRSQGLSMGFASKKD